MSTSKEFVDYIYERLDNSPEITIRPMMGEYLLYFRGRLVGGIYDNRLLVKSVKSAQMVLPDAPMQLPYDGAARTMILVENTDDGEFLYKLFSAMYEELPEPKSKKKVNKNEDN